MESLFLSAKMLSEFPHSEEERDGALRTQHYGGKTFSVAMLAKTDTRIHFYN